MDRDVIETFLKIAEYHTISKTADILFASQSTISHRLQVLESYLGVKLFERQKGVKSVSLTPYGEKFYALAHQWLDLDDNMRNLYKTTPYRKINIGGLDSVYKYLLFPILPQIKKNLPLLPMECFSHHSQEIYRRLSSRALDVGFAFFPIQYSDLHAVPVFREPIMMISLPGSDYAEGVIHPHELDKADEIYFSWDSNLAQWHEEWWPRYIPPFVKVDSATLLVNFMCHSKSWALCPASLATSLRAEYGMKVHSFAVPPPDRVCYMLTRRSSNNEQEENVRIFSDCFFELLDSHPWRYDRPD